MIVTVLMCAGSMNISKIVEAQKTVRFFIPLFPMFILFFISGLAETNRTPFDLVEGESELVAELARAGFVPATRTRSP